MIPDSPADLAGLLPYGDYIVGTPEGILRGESGLPELVEDYLQRPLRLWVYNHEYAVTRLVTITPSRSWGGEGALGCVLGFGALHQLPPPLNEPPSGPGETLFETARFSNEETRLPQQSADEKHSLSSSSSFVSSNVNYASSTTALLTPATMAAPPPLAASRTVPAAKRGRKSPSKAFDQMWEESEEKSKDDFTPKAKATPPPPPPKAGPGGGVAVVGEGAGATLQVPEPEERTQTRSPDPILDEDDID